MEKKGLLHLVVEIDYDKMITPEGLTALQAFTGAVAEDDIAKHHMDGLGRKLTEIVKDLPLMRYEITGELIAPIEEPAKVEEESPEEDSPSTVEETEPVDSSILDEDEEDPLTVLEELDEALDDVSMSKGMPISITINSFTEAAIRDSVEVYDGVIEQYKGFDIHTESMEDNFIIKYKEYGGGAIGSISSRGEDSL